MKGKTLFAVLFLLVAAPCAFAAQGVLPISFGSWTASAPPAQISARDLDSVAQDKADILREYGVSSAEKADYAQNGQATTVVLYKMTDPSAAFGAFTFLRSQDLAPIAVPRRSGGVRGGIEEPRDSRDWEFAARYFIARRSAAEPGFEGAGGQRVPTGGSAPVPADR